MSNWNINMKTEIVEASIRNYHSVTADDFPLILSCFFFFFWQSSVSFSSTFFPSNTIVVYLLFVNVWKVNQQATIHLNHMGRPQDDGKKFNREKKNCDKKRMLCKGTRPKVNASHSHKNQTWWSCIILLT